MRIILRLITVLVAGISLCGCQTLGRTTLISSSAPQDLSPGAAATIARDLAGSLAERVGVGTTTISFAPDGSAFGYVLEEELRSEGYAISTDPSMDLDGGFLPLAYVVDRFEGSVIVRLSTPDLTLTRIYAITAENAEPASPWSVMTIGGDGSGEPDT